MGWGQLLQHIASLKAVHKFDPRNCSLLVQRILVVTVTCICMPLFNTTEGSIIKSGLTMFNLSWPYLFIYSKSYGYYSTVFDIGIF